MILTEQLDLSPYCDKVAGNTLFFTVSSLGFLPYTLNLIESTKRVAGLPPLLVIILDPNGYNLLMEKLQPDDLKMVVPIYYPNRLSPTRHALFGRRSFDDLTNLKLLLAYKLLKKGFNILYTDGDVVFLKNPLEVILRGASEQDVLIQNDTEDVRDASLSNLCTGFYYAKPSSAVVKAFSPVQFTVRSWFNRLFRVRNGGIPGRYDDQVHFNGYIRHKVSLSALPAELFPNGACYLKGQADLERAYIIHFNHMVGAAKMEKMKADGFWFC